MSYDTWKTRSDYDEEARYYSGPSRKQIDDKIEALDHEIGWNICRLSNLVLTDEDREQTEDYIMELRQERDCLAASRKPGSR